VNGSAHSLGVGNPPESHREYYLLAISLGRYQRRRFTTLQSIALGCDAWL